MKRPSLGVVVLIAEHEVRVMTIGTDWWGGSFITVVARTWHHETKLN